jgi:CheY-like chemotaxis protein
MLLCLAALRGVYFNGTEMILQECIGAAFLQACDQPGPADRGHSTPSPGLLRSFESRLLVGGRAVVRASVARVLVVEDDQEIRDLIVLRLLMVGHSVVARPDGASALDIVDQIGAPDAYVLDVGLPDIDGFRLLSRLREEGEDAPVIFLSAHAEPSELGLAAAMGARYLTKPFVAKALIAEVDDAVAGRESSSGTEHGW